MNIIKNLKNPKKIPTRNGYGEGLVIAGEKNPNIVVLCADLTESTRSHLFREKFPKRFIEMGVAEQNMASVASGLAISGKVPFISSYAMFSPGRNWEQIRTTICYNNVNVKIAGAHAGVSVGPDGATHQALEDLAIMRVLPDMTVIAPGDYLEARKATIAVAEYNGPVYLRFAREATPVFTTEKSFFKIGKANILRKGKNLTIIACGPLVYEALLAGEKFNAEVINCHTIKPLDKQTILKSVKKTKRVITVEEHQIAGGLGSAIAEFLSQEYPVSIKMVGVKDRFGESGQPEELLDKFGLTSKFIKKACLT